MRKKESLFVLLLALTMIAMVGCSGNDGATGPAGTVDYSNVEPLVDEAVAAASLNAESCAVCHKTAGADHQAVYDGYWQDAVIKATDITYAYAAGTTTVTFKMTKSGAAFDCTAADNLSIMWGDYNGTGFVLNAATEASAEGRTALKGTVTYSSATGVCTSTLLASTLDPGDLSAKNGIIAIYGREEQASANLGTSRVRPAKYPFAGIKVMGTVGYTSASVVSGCEKCHTIPYFKHGYIYGEAGAKGAGKDFYTCKVCHFDDGTGGHFEWQLLVENPELAQQYLAGTVSLTAAQEAQYAYKTTLMNDVHMSHAMEFPYPQSMSNCVVCHEGKISTILADSKFKLETCKSCHPVTGSETVGTVEIALNTIVTHAIPADGVCNNCHKTGGIAPVFSAIHSGYDKKIYAAAGVKYSDIFKVTINSVAKSGNDLTIKFSATKTDPTGASSLAVTSITPTVLVGLYGYDTKDFIVDAHGRTIDTARNLEYAWGSTNARFTPVSAANGSWEVKVSLANWASLITDGTVKRLEVGVLPALKNADGDNVPVSSPTKTFDIATNALVTYFDPIVKVSTGCDNCHGALGVTFHSAQYGTAGVVGCRLCHTTRSGGSHLEMQSRSIDSYAHAIHSFAPFDYGDIDFADAVAEMEYEHHIEFLYPTFLIQNCESCHVAGKYEVPDQAKSLGGTLSAADTNATKDRSIGAVPGYITGPGSRACGSCHRTVMINEDAAGDLTSLNQHVKTFGYLAEVTTTNSATIFDTVITKIMETFK